MQWCGCNKRFDWNENICECRRWCEKPPKKVRNLLFLPKCHYGAFYRFILCPFSRVRCSKGKPKKRKFCEKEEIIRFLLFFHLNKMSMMVCDTNTHTLRNFHSTAKKMKKNEKRDTWIVLQVCMYIVYNVEEKNYCLMSGNIEPKME